MLKYKKFCIIKNEKPIRTKPQTLFRLKHMEENYLCRLVNKIKRI